ncbi:unnamed protein product, partial [Iphiclides podalirius]
MGDRRENIKRSLGITEYPWSSDDEEINIPTDFRRPNDESDLSNDTNEEPRGSNSPTWINDQRHSRLEQEQIWALLHDPNRASRQDGQRSMLNSPSDNMHERFPAIQLKRIVSYKKVRRRDGTTYRHAYVRPAATPMDLRANAARARRGDQSRMTLPMLSGASIISLVMENGAAPVEPQPSTSRGLAAALATLYPSSRSNSPTPTDTLPANEPLPANGPPPIMNPIPSTNTTPEPYIRPEESYPIGDAPPTTPTGSAPTDNLDQPTIGDDEHPQRLNTLPPTEGRDATDGETGNTDDREMQVAREEVVLFEPESHAARASVADGGCRPNDLHSFVTMEPCDMAVASSSQPQPESQSGKRKRKGSGSSSAEPYTVKEFNQCLLRLLECPVCLEWMEPPVAQCRRGHLVCSRCRSRLSSCPVCRTAFSTVRNRAMEGVAELLRYPCRHGCGREVRLRRRGAHEASCSARRYRCPAPPCNERAPLPLAELLSHLQKKHTSLMKNGKTHKFSMKMNTKQHDTWLVLVGHELFHMRIDVDIRSWGIVVYVAYIGPKCKASNFTYEVTVVGQNNERRLVYSRVTHSDLESSSLNVSRQDCFHLTLDQALNFLRLKNKHCEPDKFLDFIVEINSRDVNETPSEESNT